MVSGRFKDTGLGWWLGLLGLLILIKAAAAVIDHQPLFLFGDSSTYLVTAMEKYIPPDRSFVYGFLVRRIAIKSYSLGALTVAQTVAGILSCLILVWIVRRHFKVRARYALAAGLLCSAAPLQLLFERHLMTESFSLLALALAVLAAFTYLRSQRVWWLLVFQVAGVVLISLRMSNLTLVAGGTVLLPLLICLPAASRGGSPRDRISSWPGMRLAVHLLVSMLCFAALHFGYRQLNGYLSGKPPAWLYADGFFKLAAWAPVMEIDDGVDRRSMGVLRRLDQPGERELDRRRYHRWDPEGLVRRISRMYPDPGQANEVAGRVAWNTLWRAPLEVSRVAAATYFGYFRVPIGSDPVLALSPLPPDFVHWIDERFGRDASGWGQRRTPMQSYFGRARSWYWVVLLSPWLTLPMILLANPKRRPGLLFLLWVSVSVLGAFCLVNTGWSLRHLHHNAWLAILVLTVLVDIGLAGWARSHREPAG